MSRTIADAVRQAREILQDEESGYYRYSDQALIDQMNNAVATLQQLRPDFFVYGEALPNFTVADISAATDYPLPWTTFNPVVYYVAGNAELRDDEFTVDGRAMALLQAFTMQVKGVQK